MLMGAWTVIALSLRAWVVTQCMLLRRWRFVSSSRSTNERPNAQGCGRVTAYFGLAVQVVARLALRADHGSARHRCSLAPRGMLLGLAGEVQKGATGTATNRARSPRLDPTHVARQSDLGRTVDSIGTYSAGIFAR